MHSRTALLFNRYTVFIALLVTILISGILFMGPQVNADETNTPAPPAPRVEFITIEHLDIRDWKSFSGHLAPVEIASIKPLVSGTITEVLFKDGQQVKTGDPLFIIDPRPYRHVVIQAKANLATANSRLVLAKDEFSRAETLNTRRIASDSILDTALNNLHVAQASVSQAEGALDQALLDLEYAHIIAPISGKIGRAELTVGNVVEAGSSAPILTSIIRNDQLYAEFNVDEQSYIDLIRRQPGNLEMPVDISIGNLSSKVYEGKEFTFDNHLDSNNGTIRARALVNNNDGVLTSGLFVNVRVGSAQTDARIVIPERAIGTNQNRKFVYVVDAQSTVHYREIELGHNYQGQRIVLKGLATGEQVVVNGISHIAPNSVVNAIPVDNNELLVSR